MYVVSLFVLFYVCVWQVSTQRLLYNWNRHVYIIADEHCIRGLAQLRTGMSHVNLSDVAPAERGL